MLIQMPRGPSDKSGEGDAGTKNAFEAALRRDLASAPVVSYDAVLGGAAKRSIDLALSVLSAPVWAPVMLVTAIVAKLRHGAPVFVAEERIGYGGHSFKRYSLRVSPPKANIEQVIVEGAAGETASWSVIEQGAEDPRAKWRRTLERLPQMINVIRGDMALVGPRALSRDGLEPLKSARRHYLSCRPGIVGISAVVNAGEEEFSQYKVYGMCWSVTTDALILWDAMRGLRNRGELWRPSLKLNTKPTQRPVIVRQRIAP